MHKFTTCYNRLRDLLESATIGSEWCHRTCIIALKLLLISFSHFAYQIVPFLNGFRHIDRIAQLAEVSATIVTQCIKHLVLLGVCVVVPAFQYSNIYRPTPKLNQLAKSPEVQKRAIEKCSKSELKKAKIRDILLLFASMTHGEWSEIRRTVKV